MISLPPGTKVFQFPGLAFLTEWPNWARFPHSEIPGSKLVWQLPEAYRSLLRPSSPTSAKASSVHP